MVEQTNITDNLLEIEVAYAKPEEQVIINLNVLQGTTAEQAVNQSGLLVKFPEINGSALKIGIFGAVCQVEQLVKSGDRVEIYRTLLHDPKEARRQRAANK